MKSVSKSKSRSKSESKSVSRSKSESKSKSTIANSAKKPADHHHHDHPHDHDHSHGHDHDHNHETGHEHVHAHGPTRPDLKPGAGRGKILFLDAASGIAGDMTIAALVDLGVPEDVVAEAVAQIPIDGYHLHFGSRARSGIVATTFDVHVEAKQPERTFGEIRAMISRAKIHGNVKKRALATFERLAMSESKVHRMPIDEVHFHEVGAVDAIVDVVGSAAALEHLGAEVWVSPLPMGRGHVKARHGVLPLPAPATVECLRGFDTYDGGHAFEFVTPTGAAIVAAHAQGSVRWPSFAPELVGWSSGTATLPDRPNLLRAILGSPMKTHDRESAEKHGHSREHGHVVIEANLDDATGEVVASCIEALLREGALDAWAAPITMKKGRPAVTLGAIAAEARADAIAHAMIRESTTLGVRITHAARVERPRRMLNVKTAYGEIPVKISEGPFGPALVKPEFDACADASRTHGVPVREVIRAALVAASRIE